MLERCRIKALRGISALAAVLLHPIIMSCEKHINLRVDKNMCARTSFPPRILLHSSVLCRTRYSRVNISKNWTVHDNDVPWPLLDSQYNPWCCCVLPTLMFHSCTVLCISTINHRKSTFLVCESLDEAISLEECNCMTCSRGCSSSDDNKWTDRTIIATLLELCWKKKNIT